MAACSPCSRRKAGSISSAGGGISGANFKDFGVNFGLTPLGLEHVDDILAALFGYLKLIAREGLQSWRYDEKRTVLESAFRFQERGRPSILCQGWCSTSLATNLRICSTATT